MTTIVFRDGIMAADTRAYSGHPTPIGEKQKIYRLDDGSLLGVSTTKPGLSETFRNWINDGSDYDKVPINPGPDLNLTAILVNTKGEVYYYHDDVWPSGPIYAKYYAIGSGDQYAYGALSCGASAEAAVAVASQHDPWTGDKIQKIPLMTIVDAKD